MHHRRHPVRVQPDFGPARQWQSDIISHFAVSLLSASDSDDDTTSSVLTQFDWNEIYSCLADMDLELVTHQPCISHALDVALPAKIKNDPDSPTFHDAITGEYEDEYWEAMDKEIAGLGPFLCERGCSEVSHS